jgi:hypothetical protein
MHVDIGVVLMMKVRDTDGEEKWELGYFQRQTVNYILHTLLIRISNTKCGMCI